MSYDPDADVLTVHKNTKAHIDYATEMGDFVVHFTKQNTPVLIEVLNASKVVGQGEETIMKATQKVL